MEFGTEDDAVQQEKLLVWSKSRDDIVHFLGTMKDSVYFELWKKTDLKDPGADLFSVKQETRTTRLALIEYLHMLSPSNFEAWTEEHLRGSSRTTKELQKIGLTTEEAEKLRVPTEEPPEEEGRQLNILHEIKKKGKKS